jgi:hypothetical protein
MNFCDRDNTDKKTSDMPAEKKLEVETGIVWPKDKKGERSTTAAGKEIWARSTFFSLFKS